MTPTLSIIIVNWNTIKLLRNCLTSIYQQIKTLDFEVWVVDNASSDNSVAMVKESFPQVKLINNFANLGFARANNLAIKQSTGEHILLLNSDTILLTDLHNICNFMDLHSQIGMVGAKVVNPDHTIQETCVRKFPTITSKITNYFRIGSRVLKSLISYLENDPNFDYHQSQPVPIVSGAFMLLPRPVIEKVGLLDESFFLYGEDLDWARRIHNAGYQIWYSPLAEIIHFGSQSSLQVAEKTHFIRIQNIARYFDMYHGRSYGNLYRGWIFLIALLGYIPTALVWLLTPNRYHKERLHEFLAVFARIIRDPKLQIIAIV